MQAQVSQGFKREEYNSAYAPQLLQVLQNVRQDSHLCVKLRTGNRGSCKVSDYWHENSTRPGREGVLQGFEAAYKLATVQSRHATLAWTNGDDSSFPYP